MNTAEKEVEILLFDLLPDFRFIYVPNSRKYLQLLLKKALTALTSVIYFAVSGAEA
jgi:hypothetical protein